jgi:acyl carrier protein
MPTEQELTEKQKEILKDFAEIIKEETGISTEDVTWDKSFTDDLDIDSLSMMTIVVNTEEKFDVRIPDDDVKDLKKVSDAVKYIEKAQKEQDAKP